jgi:branched-chain amino acid transport system ATP-binding protein
MKRLRVEGIHVAYGPVQAVRDVSFDVDEGEVVALVGSNGAGKSTTLKTIMGLLVPSAGDILLDGLSVRGRDPAEIVRRGIALSPEGRRVFGKMSVHENLLAGAHLHHDRAGNQERMQKIYERFPRLRERRSQLAGSMSGGEQQMLAIGRALMARPRLLLLDEPTLGLAPIMVREIADTVNGIRAEGMSILLVEQNANMALRLADRAVVVENGAVAMTGTGRELLASEHIRSFYLGL